MPFAATWMGLEINILSEVSQTEKDKYHMILLVCGILKKNGTNELIYKTRVESQMQKTNLWLPEGKEEEGISQETRINIYTLLCIKQITNKNLLYSTGNSTQYSVMTYMEKNLKKSKYMYIYK